MLGQALAKNKPYDPSAPRGPVQTATANPNVEDPRAHLVPAREAAKARVRAKIRLFRSAGTVSTAGGFKSPPTQHRVADIGEAE